MFSLDGDLGRHIVIGNVILETGQIPQNDLFSHTMYGDKLVPHEWLGQVLFAFVYSFFSLTGVVFLSAILIAGSFTIVYIDSFKRSRAPVLSLFVAVMAAFAASLHWLNRPHIFTFTYLAIWVLFLEKERTRGDVSSWIFFLIMLFWANTHGAFIAGFVSLFAYLIGQVIDSWSGEEKLFAVVRPWLRIAGLSVLASLINPAGAELWATSVGYVKNSYLVGHTQEYLSPNFHNVGMSPFLILVILFVFSLKYKGEKMPWAYLFLFTGWLVMGLYSARNVPLFAIITAPILAAHLSNILGVGFWRKLEERIKTIENKGKNLFLWSSLVVLVAFFFAKHPVLDTYNRFPLDFFPVEAVNWLDTNEQNGNVFNYFPWGGYLLYRQWPGQLVFIDGQTDFYGEFLTQEYERVISLSDGWETILDNYQVEWAIIPSSSSLADALENISWEVLYEDETAIVLRRE